jgi:hypothetical protein
MSNENNTLKRHRCEIDNTEEEETEFEIINHENSEEENELPEKSNSALSTLDETDKKNKSAVWNHFDKFTDNKGVIWAKCRYCG